MAKRLMWQKRACLLGGMLMFCGAISASENDFVDAYDAGEYEKAARQIDGLDASNPRLARRLGVMYYEGLGIAEDRERGKELLENALLSGDAQAAINLAKIYFRRERNEPKAAWCLLVAEEAVDPAVKADVEALRGLMGKQYFKNVALYIAQLRVALRDERVASKKREEESDGARVDLQRQISIAAERRKVLEAKLRQTEEAVRQVKLTLAAEKTRADGLATDLINANAKVSTAETECRKRMEDLAAAKASCQALIEKYNSLVASSNRKILSKESEAVELAKQWHEAKRKIEETEKRCLEKDRKYKELKDMYNGIVEKHNKLKELYKEATRLIPIKYF